MGRKGKFWTKNIKSHKSRKVIWHTWQSVERPLHWRRGESLQKLKVNGGQMCENGLAEASLGYIEWIVVLSLETFPQLECSNMSVGSPPLTPPCRCLLGLANRHHAIIHKSAHLYLLIQSAKIYVTLHLHVQPSPSWYPLGFAWWSASNGCGLIYVLSTSQSINTPGSECIYFCTTIANPKQIREATFRGQLFICIISNPTSRNIKKPIWTFEHVIDFRQQEWLGWLGGLIFRLLNIWLFESRETAPLGKIKKLKTFMRKRRIGVEEQAHKPFVLLITHLLKGLSDWTMARHISCPGA